MNLDEALAAVKAEVIRATTKHPRTFASPHDGWAVLYEEVDEMWDEVKGNNLEASKHEAVQVAAMGGRYLMDL